jgi:hypothetical protein
VNIHKNARTTPNMRFGSARRRFRKMGRGSRGLHCTPLGIVSATIWPVNSSERGSALMESLSLLMRESFMKRKAKIGTANFGDESGVTDTQLENTARSKEPIIFDGECQA